MSDAVRSADAASPARRRAAATGWGILSSGSAIGLLATSGWLITRASLQPPVLSLCVAIGLVQAFSLGRGVTRYLQRLAVHRVALGDLSSLRLRLFDHLVPLVPGWSADRADGQRPSGEVLAGFLSDAEAVAEGGAKRATVVVDVAASVALGSSVAFALSPLAGAALVAGALLTVGLVVGAGRLGRAATRSEVAARSELAGQVVEAVGAARELVAFGRQDLVVATLATSARRCRHDALHGGLATGLGRLAGAWGAGGTTVAVVAAGLAAHRAGNLSGVMLAVVAFVALAVAEPVAALPHALTGMVAGRSAADRLDRLGTVPPPAPEPPTDASPPPGAVVAALEDARVDGDGGRAVLEHVSLSVEPARRVALVGPSGSGKSTAVHALLHFVECRRGRATLGGVDVRAMQRSGIARHTAWLPEEVHLFAASLADNLRVGRPSATDADCADALRRVGLGQWLGSLPDGLATLVGDGGRPVSAGERQRLGMARALLDGQGVLLLDEPTAHVDPETAPAVLDDLLASAGRRPVLVVSHEPGIGEQVDEVVAMDAGRTLGPSGGAHRRPAPAHLAGGATGTVSSGSGSSP